MSPTTVLAARARRLARRPAGAPTVASLDLLVFELGCERYAIETRHVREVVRGAALTPVPGTADFVLGLTNLRGELVPVIDLRRLLGTAAAEVTQASSLVILGDERAQLGVLTDAVHDVSTVPTQAIADVIASSEATREHLRGVTCEGLVILSGESLLANTRLVLEATDEPGA